jgi:hypothetical protein
MPTAYLRKRTTTDHRGRRIPLDLARCGFFGNYKGHMSREVFEHIRADLLRRRGHRLPDWVVIVGSTLVWACFAIFAVYMLTIAWSLPLALLSGTALVINCASLAVYRQYVPRTSSKVLVEHCLAHACCAACGYDLSAIEPTAGHARICPECGAAWVLEPQHRPPPPPSPWFRAGRFLRSILVAPERAA